VSKALFLEPPNPLRQCRVVLCGDILPHRQVFSDALSATTGLTVVRCSENREGVLSICQQLNASLLIAKEVFIQQLPSADFVRLTDYGRGTHVLAILEMDGFEASTNMLRHGCRGVLPPRFSMKLVKRASLAVLEGELWAPPRVISSLLSELLKGVPVKEKNGLTPQEQRILELSVQGYKNSAIANELFISTETVRWHKRRLYRKIGKSGAPRLPHTLAAPRNPVIAAG
jgi:DNA-binding NarL/FixJ family response regulator